MSILFPAALQQSFEYVTSFISTRVELSKGIRKEIKLFDKAAFREAWINACVHNAWSEKLAPAVYLFDDRIEVVSYGSIPYDLSMEGFFAGTSMPENFDPVQGGQILIVGTALLCCKIRI